MAQSTAKARVSAPAKGSSALALVVALLLLNLLDGAFTTVFLQLGLAVEANPIMRLAWERSPLTFMVAKMALVYTGVLALWWNREARAARVALQVAVGVYAAIVGWHLAMLARIASA